MTMLGLTPDELAAVRADFNALVLPEVCTIRRRGPDGTWGDVAVDVACRLTPGAEGDDWSDVASQVRATATLRLPAGTDITRLDRVRVTGEGGTVLVDVVYVPATTRVHRSVLVRPVEST